MSDAAARRDLHSGERITPTPYYDEDGVAIYHGRAEDILPALERGAADLIFTSPPYNMGVTTGGGFGHGQGYAGGKWRAAQADGDGFRYDNHHDAMPPADNSDSVTREDYDRLRESLMRCGLLAVSERQDGCISRSTAARIREIAHRACWPNDDEMANSNMSGFVQPPEADADVCHFTRCPTCGQPVSVWSADEGTSSYVGEAVKALIRLDDPLAWLAEHYPKALREMPADYLQAIRYAREVLADV